MVSAVPVASRRRRAPVLSVVSVIVVVLGVLAMHAISTGAQCTAADSTSITPAHASGGNRATPTVYMQDEHTDATAHAVSDCVATPSRKAVSLAGTLPTVALTLGALTTGDIYRRRQLARIPDRLSVAGGLRR